MKKNLLPILALLGFSFCIPHRSAWYSKYVTVGNNGNLLYLRDANGNIIPDFSRVGYYSGDRTIPDVPIIKTLSPGSEGSSENIIQSAIDEVSQLNPGTNGLRGTIFLKRGTYVIPGQIKIVASGIVLRGEGNETKIIAA